MTSGCFTLEEIKLNCCNALLFSILKINSLNNNKFPYIFGQVSGQFCFLSHHWSLCFKVQLFWKRPQKVIRLPQKVCDNCTDIHICLDAPHLHTGDFKGFRVCKYI